MDNTEKKQNWRKKMRGYLYDYGKLLVDIAKLAFGSLVLGTVIRWDIPQATVFVTGVIFSIVVATIGIFLARTFEEK